MDSDLAAVPKGLDASTEKPLTEFPPAVPILHLLIILKVITDDEAWALPQPLAPPDLLLRALGDPQRALREVCRVRALQPNNPELLLEEARIRMALNQWKQSAAVLDTCAMLLQTNASEQQRPWLAETCMWRGLLCERSTNNPAAAALLADAMRLEPGMYGVLANRVAALQSGKNPDLPVAEVFAKYQRMSANPLCNHDHHAHGAEDHDDE